MYNFSHNRDQIYHKLNSTYQMLKYTKSSNHEFVYTKKVVLSTRRQI